MRARTAGIRIVVLVALTAGVIASPVAAAADDDLYDASVRHLERTMSVQRDGSHLARLFALRQLRDPALRPLLFRLAENAEWQVQVHAVLGLAEIDESERVDPWLVSQIGEPAREALIANAIDMELLTVEQIPELLQWEDLRPMSKALLMGELLLAERPIDRDALARLAANSDIRVAGLASMLLVQLGDRAAFSAMTDRLDKQPARDWRRHVEWLLEAIRQYELTALQPWVESVIRAERASPEVRYWAVFTLMVLDPPAGAVAWSETLGEQPSLRDRVRFGMLLLAAGADTPVSAYDRIGGDDDLTRCMQAVGRAMSDGRNPAPALNALLDLGHVRTAEWAMGFLPDLPDDQEATVYRHLIETVGDERVGRPERIARAVIATTRLAEIDPDIVLGRLAEVEDDSLDQEVVLLGLFESESPDVGAAARGLRRIGVGRADTLALLLIARHTPQLDSKDLERLGTIAAAGGRVSEGLQAQAAWLYLKHSGGLDRALDGLLNEGS